MNTVCAAAKNGASKKERTNGKKSTYGVESNRYLSSYSCCCCYCCCHLFRSISSFFPSISFTVNKPSENFHWIRIQARSDWMKFIHRIYNKANATKEMQHTEKERKRQFSVQSRAKVRIGNEYDKMKIFNRRIYTFFDNIWHKLINVEAVEMRLSFIFFLLSGSVFVCNWRQPWWWWWFAWNVKTAKANFVFFLPFVKSVCYCRSRCCCYRFGIAAITPFTISIFLCLERASIFFSFEFASSYNQ